jgi:hypothetical protein
MLELMKKHQNLLMLQTLTFSLLFATVLIVSSIVYNQTTVYSAQKSAQPTKELKDGIGGFFETMSDRQY